MQAGTAKNPSIFSEQPYSPVIGNGHDPAGIITKCTEQLSDLNSTTEKDFLLTGTELNSIYIRSKNISRTAVSSSELANSERVREDAGKLHGFLETLNRSFLESQGRLQHSSETLKRILGLINNAFTPISSFRRIVKHLHILGVSAKIENARILSSDNSFFLLAEDVEKLSLVIEKKSEDISKGLVFLRSSIETTLSQILNLKDLEYNKTQNTLDHTRTILKMLSEKRLLSSQTVGRLTDQSKYITEAISDVVSSLQFHDITRQQIEHVIITLNEVTHMVPSGDNRNAVIAGLVAGIGELQITQLENARKELVSALNRITKDLKGIVHNVSAMSKESKSLLHVAGHEGTSFLHELIGSLELVVSFFSENENTSRELTEALKSASGTLGKLSEYVNDIEDIGEEIELIALNARVKAARSASDGAALSVIAEAITNLSDNARNQTRVIAAILKDIHDGAMEMNAVENEMNNKADGNAINMMSDMKNLSDTTQQYDERIMSLLDNIDTEAAELAQAIDAIINGITAHTRTDRVIGKVTGELKSLIAYGHTVAIPEEERAKTKAYMDGIAHRYTMDQERHIHQMHLGENTITDNIPATDHFDDNIELF